MINLISKIFVMSKMSRNTPKKCSFWVNSGGAVGFFQMHMEKNFDFTNFLQISFLNIFNVAQWEKTCLEVFKVINLASKIFSLLNLY